ncbi:MAG: hypothetical protein ABL962_08020 [Fimbriimonadaceae bacterium]
MLRGLAVRHAFALTLMWMILALTSPAAAAAKYCSDTADNVVIYIDRTTPYDDLDKKELVDGISRLFEGLAGGERLSMRTIADSFTTSTSLLDECVPFCPDGGLLGDLFGACTEGVMLNDRKHLKGNVVAQLEELLGDFVELPNSEIVRTLGRSLPTELRAGGRANRLYLFTDLIENSVYLPGKEFFAEKNDVLIRRIQADGLVPNLSGVAVRVFGVGRGGNPNDRHPLDQALLSKLEDFWTRYFEAGGTTVSIAQSLGAVN